MDQNVWNEIVSRLLAVGIFALTSVGGCLSTGCAPPAQTDAVQYLANRFTSEVVGPAVREGLAQGVETLQIQAGAQGINPTYVVEFEGKWVVGIEGRATIGVEGVAGQIQVSSLSTEETETSPHADEANTNGAN